MHREKKPTKRSGKDQTPATTALAPPIYPATVYACDSPQQASDLLAGNTDGFIYSRDGHPNSDMLAEQCKAWHHAEQAAIAGSGMAALALSLLSNLQQGDHVVISHQLYGRTLALFTTEAARLGITSSEVDTCDLTAVRKAMRESTKLVIAETIANPMLQVADIASLAEIAHARAARLLIDNTFASPVFCRPLDWGADLVVESMTKIMNGHSDVILGCLCGNSAVWDRVPETASTWGLFASPHSCWLAMRGMSTLDLRVKRAASTALELAERLAEHPALLEIRYPGLETARDRPLAEKQFATDDGVSGFGNMLTFRLAGDLGTVEKFIYAVSPDIPFCPSLGDLKTTLSHPESTSHRELAEAQREQLEIYPGTIRLSVGIEEASEISAHIERGLQAIS